MRIHKVSLKMAIKQVIQYSSDNKYFAGFLEAMMLESGIDGSITQADGSIVLRLNESDEKALNRLNVLTSKYLPQSIFLGDIQTLSVETHGTHTPFTSPTYNIAPCPKCLELLSDPASPLYLDDSLQCNHYSNESNQLFADVNYYSPHYSQGSELLVTDPSALSTLFYMTEDEMKALFSIEKPSLKVTIKDETLKEMSGKNFIYISSPSSVKSNLVALNAKESGIKYLFFQPSNELKVMVVQKNSTIIRDTKNIATSLANLDKDPVINRFLNIAQEAGFTNGALAANLSRKNGISFILSSEMGNKRVVNFQTFVLKDVLEGMKKDAMKSKLLLNFGKVYPQVLQELEENEAYDLFETIATILELSEKSFEAVSDKALEFRGNGGLKIDANFSDEGFDYASFLGSIMSFKLANTDAHYLAYSIFEALGDMSITTLNQLKTKFKVNHFVMMGDMFENSVLYSRILSKFQLSNPYFPKSFALDD